MEIMEIYVGEDFGNETKKKNEEKEKVDGILMEISYLRIKKKRKEKKEMKNAKVPFPPPLLPFSIRLLRQ